MGLAAWLATYCLDGCCFEFSTHAAMTREAVRLSRVTTTTALLMNLGLSDRVSDLGLVYIDIGPADTARLADPAEPQHFGPRKIEDANKLDPKGERPTLPSLIGWAMLGAIREDDVKYDSKSTENTPQDVPGGPIDRVRGHFFDPIDETGVSGIDAPATDWALGLRLGADNHFSVAAAREAMWRAATLTTLDQYHALIPLSLPAAFPPVTPVIGEQPELEALRYAYWATVFRSLGDAVHLLQDMAQPQHTRWDLHGGRYCLLSICLVGHPSYLESYVEAKVAGAPSFALQESKTYLNLVPSYTEQVALAPPNMLGYSPPDFADHKLYFTSASGSQSIAGKGLANYSNQGFFTPGTNLGSSTSYVSPPLVTAAYVRTVIPAGSVLNAKGRPVPGGALALFQRPVSDANSGQSTIANLSSSGAFDQYLQPTGKSQFSLNHYNYDDQASLLLPRAVAYSAGFINYFFRGQLDMALPAEHVYGIVDHTVEQSINTSGFRKLKVKVTNHSPAGNDLSNGLFVVVARFHRDRTYAPDLSGNPGGKSFQGFWARTISEEILVSNPTVLSNTLAVNGQLDLSFDFPKPIPINASDLVLQVVYRGKMGSEEDAVVVGTKDISEPTFFGFANNTDYVWDGTGQRFMPLPFGGYSAPNDVSLKVRFDSPTGRTIATIPRLSAKQHAQIAVLTDVGTGTVYYDYQPAGISQTYPTVPVPFPATQFYSPLNSIVYDANVKVALKRGVYRQTYASIMYPYDDISACLPGFERCTQATLPALSPADRVAWTVSF